MWEALPQELHLSIALACVECDKPVVKGNGIAGGARWAGQHRSPSALLALRAVSKHLRHVVDSLTVNTLYLCDVGVFAMSMRNSWWKALLEDPALSNARTSTSNALRDLSLFISWAWCLGCEQHGGRSESMDRLAISFVMELVDKIGFCEDLQSQTSVSATAMRRLLSVFRRVSLQRVVQRQLSLTTIYHRHGRLGELVESQSD